MEVRIELGSNPVRKELRAEGNFGILYASNTCSKNVLLSASPKNSADSSTPGRSEDVSDGL